jgi:hypothetical protein
VRLIRSSQIASDQYGQHFHEIVLGQRRSYPRRHGVRTWQCPGRPVSGGWSPLADQWRESAALGIDIMVCDACRQARGVTPEAIEASGARIGTPVDFVEGVEWAEKIVAE